MNVLSVTDVKERSTIRTYDKSTLVDVFNRPGVAFPPNLQDIINPNPLELRTWHFKSMFTLHYVSHVTCQVPGVRCQVSHFICQMSHIYIFFFLLSDNGFKCDYWDNYLEKKGKKNYVTITVLCLWIFSVLLVLERSKFRL